MNASTGRTLVQLGGIGLALSLFLPWYSMVVPNLASEGFTIWEFDKTLFWGAVVVASLCVVQPKITSADGMGILFMLLGAAATGALVYKLWINPPLGMGGMELQGGLKEMAEGMMEAFGIETKPAYGAYIAVAGTAAVAAGGFIGFRMAPDTASGQYAQESWQSTHGDPYNAQQQRYVRPEEQYSAPQQQYMSQQQQYASQQANPAQRSIAPDPFAPPAAMQPDPFAVPPQQPQQQQQQ
jgi:hypothetical protein